MKIEDVVELIVELGDVRRTASEGRLEWRHQGRLIARQLDDEHVVIRAAFESREVLLRQFPETFTVPTRYEKHMMVVADLATGDVGAIEDAIEAAWLLQHERPPAGCVPAAALPFS